MNSKIYLVLVFILLVPFSYSLDLNGTTLKAFWTMRDTSDSKGSYTLTNTNGVTQDSSGSHFTASNQYLSRADSTDFRGMAKFSFSCQIQRHGDTIGGGGTGNGAIISFDSGGIGGGRDWNSFIFDSGGAVANAYHVKVWATAGIDNNANTTNSDTNWHCFQFVFDGANSEIFVDNVTSGRQAQTGSVVNTAATLMFGKYYDTGSAYTYNGRIKDCAFYKEKALNETERKWLCANFNPVNTSSTPDTTSPTWSLPKNWSITNSSAKIYLTSNELANFTVFSGLTLTALTVKTYNTTMKNGEHLVTLTNLTNNTKYYWTGGGSDSSGNYGNYSYKLNFTTSQNEVQVTPPTPSSCDLTVTNLKIDDIKEELNMIGFIILWLGLWIFGYYALTTKNELLGGTMIVLTIPLDIYFAYQFREVLMLGTGFIGIAFGVMAAWTLGVFVLIKRQVRKG